MELRGRELTSEDPEGEDDEPLKVGRPDVMEIEGETRGSWRMEDGGPLRVSRPNVERGEREDLRDDDGIRQPFISGGPASTFGFDFLVSSD